MVGAHICPFNSVCQEWELGPKFGIASFDDIFRALVVVFQVITLEGWSAVYFLVNSFYVIYLSIKMCAVLEMK